MMEKKEEEVSLYNEFILILIVYIENVRAIVGGTIGSFIGVIIIVLITLVAVYVIYRKELSKESS